MTHLFTRRFTRIEALPGQGRGYMKRSHFQRFFANKLVFTHSLAYAIGGCWKLWNPDHRLVKPVWNNRPAKNRHAGSLKIRLSVSRAVPTSAPQWLQQYNHIYHRLTTPLSINTFAALPRRLRLRSSPLIFAHPNGTIKHLFQDERLAPTSAAQQ